jgi:hypothetical protein
MDDFAVGGKVDELGIVELGSSFRRSIGGSGAALPLSVAMVASRGLDCC